MVRTRSFDPSNALAKAVDLFSSKGYAETSMEDIVRATGVSRYGLYGTFGNKRELFEQALDKYADRMGKQAFLALLEPDASLADIRDIFAERVSVMCAQDDERAGCLFVHTAMELAPQEPELKDVLLRFMQRMARLFSVGLDTAKEKGEISADVDTRAAGEMLTNTLFGLAVLGRAGFSREALDRIVDSALATLTD